MTISWFGEDDDNNSSEDLPWLKEFMRGDGMRDDYYDVVEIYPSVKGLLLITESFKVFSFKREKSYEFILEAVEVWLSDKTIPCCLVVRPDAAGKTKPGLDHSVKNVYWVKEGSGYRRKFNTGDGKQSTPVSNPLLPQGGAYGGTPPATTSSEGKVTPIAQGATPRRGRKAP